MKLNFEKPHNVGAAKVAGLAGLGATVVLSLMVSSSDMVRWPETDGAPKDYCEFRITSDMRMADLENSIKRTYLRRLDWIEALPVGWDGLKAETIHADSIRNTRSVILKSHSLRLSNWNLFPAANGTVLMTLKKRAIATINIADNNFSFVASSMTGKRFHQGKEEMSVERIIEVMSEIEASLNHV